ncbi:WapI family immunity protein [Larkinella sp. VNQ87]|uniref:WapI family immunity protein n=1 Tax=Larkinella sp. VNQ87 TaxID=3400921 RepID=UPI003C10D5C9
MKLKSNTGSFQLSIKGYGVKGTHWRDRNSLQCELSTEWQKQFHTQLAPLQTWEIKRLINGLKLLVSRAVNHVTISFNEPGLNVEAKSLSNESFHLQIQLDHSMAPSWHPYPDFPLLVDVTLTRIQLRDIIRDLVRQLALFPER